MNSIKNILESFSDFANYNYSDLNNITKSKLETLLSSYNTKLANDIISNLKDIKKGLKNENTETIEKIIEQLENINKELSNVLDFNFNNLDDDKIKEILGKYYENFSDTTKLNICNELSKRDFDKKYIKTLFDNIKLGNIKGDKYIDLWYNLDNILNPNISSSLEVSEKIVANKYFLKDIKKYIAQKNINKLNELYELSIDDFIEVYKKYSIKNVLFKNGKIKSAKYHNIFSKAFRKLFSDNIKGEELFKILKKEGLLTDHEIFFFIDKYPDINFVLSSLGKENINGVNKISIFIRRYIKENKENIDNNLIISLLGKLLKKLEGIYKTGKKIPNAKYTYIKKLISEIKKMDINQNIAQKICKVIGEKYEDIY